MSTHSAFLVNDLWIFWVLDTDPFLRCQDKISCCYIFVNKVPKFEIEVLYHGSHSQQSDVNPPHLIYHLSFAGAVFQPVPYRANHSIWAVSLPPYQGIWVVTVWIEESFLFRASYCNYKALTLRLWSFQQLNIFLSHCCKYFSVPYRSVAPYIPVPWRKN